MDKGEVKGIGSHNELLLENEYYNALYKGNVFTLDENINVIDESFERCKKINLLNASRKFVEVKTSKMKTYKKVAIAILLICVLMTSLLGTKIVDAQTLENNKIQYIEWQDDVIASYVEKIVNKDVDEITSYEVLGIRKMMFDGENFKHIEDISKFSNLEYLEVTNCNIDDLTPFKNLKNLKILKLSNNKISSIEALSNLTQLEMLYLDNNNISYAKNINNLKCLKFVDLAGNNIVDWNDIDCFARVNKYTYVKEIHFEYERKDFDYEQWQIEVWNDDTNSQIYDLDKSGNALCMIQTNDTKLAYRIKNKFNSQLDSKKICYLSLVEEKNKNINVFISEDMYEINVN